MSKFGRSRISFTIAGLILLAASIAWGMHSYRLTSTARRATGEVINVIARADNFSTPKTYFVPVFRFVDQSGVEHTNDKSLGSKPASYHVGETVAVLYFAGAEDKAQIYDWTAAWVGPTIFLLMSLMFLAAAIAMWIWPQTMQEIERDTAQDSLREILRRNS